MDENNETNVDIILSGPFPENLSRGKNAILIFFFEV